MHAMRLARAFTGRNKIVKFEGQYHGVHDYALISVTPDNMSELGDADKPVRLAWGRGIPDAVADTIIPARYNNLALLRRLFEEQGDDIAAVIVEPVLGNAQGILPQPGFHAAMRALTEEFGILLIFDEVKTGFRFAKGGAAEFFGITPDIATYAKAMGNGYPAAAFGGRRDIMSQLPDKVSHGGTYAGNRVAAAAAVKTLEIIRDTAALETIHATGRRIQDGLARGPQPERHARTSSPAIRRCSGSCSPRRPRPSTATGRSPTTSSTTRSRSGMLARGAMPEPDSREPWFMCEAHAEGDTVDRVVSIFEESLDAALEARAHGERRRESGHGPGADVPPCRPASHTKRGTTDRWSSTVTPFARSTGPRRSSSPSATPGRGRRHRARPAARPPQVHGVAAARDAPAAGPRRAGRGDRQVPPRARRHPPRRARRADARPPRDLDARAGAARPPDPRDDRVSASSTATRC